MQDHFDSWRRSPINISGSIDDGTDTYDMEDQAHTPIYRDNPLITEGATTPRASFGLNRAEYSSTPPGTPPYPMGGAPTATPKKPTTRHAAKRAEMAQTRKASYHDLSRMTDGGGRDLGRSSRDYLLESSDSMDFLMVRSGSSGGGIPGSAPNSMNLQASTDNISLRTSTAAMKRRDSGFLSRLPSSRPEPPLHRQGSEKILTRGGGAPASANGASGRSDYVSSFAVAAAGMKMKVDPTPQKEKVLKLNVNPYTPPTSTGTASSYGYPLEMKVAVENASRYLMEFSTEDTLGQGSFGKVDLAKNRLDGWSYAIKRLQYKPSKSSVALNTVLNEIFMLASLSHPHIVRYYSAWIDEAKEDGGNSEVCIQTEFCFGGSLSRWWTKWISQSGLAEVTKASRNAAQAQRAQPRGFQPHFASNNLQLKVPFGFGPVVTQVDDAQYARAVNCIEAKLCEILRHICKALHYLHEEKLVVHLDVKPDNIFVQQDTLDLESATFKLGDFGSMRKIPAYEPAESPRGSHIAGVSSGTPILNSIESASSKKKNAALPGFASTGFAAALATPSFKSQPSGVNGASNGQSSVQTSPVQNLFPMNGKAPTTPPSHHSSGSTATTPVLGTRKDAHQQSNGQVTPPQQHAYQHTMQGVLVTPSRNALHTPVAAVMAHTIESDDIEEGDGRYLAPEFLAESGGLIYSPLLPLADIYALGCSIVELAHAALGTGNEVVLPNCFSPDFRYLVETMMAPHPSDRPSAAQLLEHELLLTPEMHDMRQQMAVMQEQMAEMQRQMQQLQQENLQLQQLQQLQAHHQQQHQQQGSSFLSASHRGHGLSSSSSSLRTSGQTSFGLTIGDAPATGFANAYPHHPGFGKSSTLSSSTGQHSWARRDVTAENRRN